MWQNFLRRKNSNKFKIKVLQILQYESDVVYLTRTEIRGAYDKFPDLRGVGGVRKSIHQSWLAKRLGLGLLWWGLKEFRKKIPREEARHSSNRLSGISTRTMHQFTTTSLSQTVWPRWASWQFLSLRIVQTLVPVTFGYSLSSEAVVMRELRRWKRLWRRSLTRSYKRTSMGPFRSCLNGTTSALQVEEITSKGTRVSCVSYQ